MGSRGFFFFLKRCICTEVPEWGKLGQLFGDHLMLIQRTSREMRWCKNISGVPISPTLEQLKKFLLTSLWSQLPEFSAGQHCVDQPRLGSLLHFPQIGCYIEHPHTSLLSVPEHTAKKKDTMTQRRESFKEATSLQPYRFYQHLGENYDLKC